MFDRCGHSGLRPEDYEVSLTSAEDHAGYKLPSIREQYFGYVSIETTRYEMNRRTNLTKCIVFLPSSFVRPLVPIVACLKLRSTDLTFLLHIFPTSYGVVDCAVKFWLVGKLTPLLMMIPCPSIVFLNGFLVSSIY